MNRQPPGTGAEARLNGIQVLLAEGRLAEAWPALEALTSDFPDHYFGQVLKGLVALKQADRNTALAAFSRAIEINPRVPESFYYLGLAFLVSADHPFAKRAFQQALELDPDHREANLGMARLYFASHYLELGPADTGIEHLLRILAAHGEDLEVLDLLLHEYGLKGEFDRLADCQARLCRLDPDRPVLKRWRDSPWLGEEGRRIYRNWQDGDREAALGYLLRCVESRPDWAEARLEAALCLYEAGRREEAREQGRRAHQLAPELWQTLLEDGGLKVVRSWIEEAFHDYQRVILLNPAAVDLTSRLQDPFFHYGRFDLADRICQMVLDEIRQQAEPARNGARRFRLLRIFTNQIGHMGHLDWYVKRGLLGRRSPDPPVIVAPQCANPHFLRYWQAYIPEILTDPARCTEAAAHGRFQEDGLCAIEDEAGVQAADYSYRSHVEIQKQWEAEGREPLLRLSGADRDLGWACLEKGFGIPAGAWFVSLHVRSDKVSRHSDGSRNVSIDTYLEAIRAITDRGGWVIRMGDPGMPRMPELPRVVDYAHSHLKSDWMDVFLWGACRFFLGTNSGPIFIPPVFGVPVVATNWTPFGVPDLFIGGLCIFKNYRLEAEDRLLSYPELLSSSLGYTNVPYLISALGVQQVDNSSEEIRDVVLEMLERLEGRITYTAEDDRLQARFASLPGKVPGVGRIGRTFLRGYAHLLEPAAGAGER